VTTDLLGAALEVSALCRKNGFRFCFIGGVAVQRWGNPRFTVDVDLTLLTGYGREEAFVDALLSELLPRRPDARSFAVANRVLLAKTRSGIDVDVALAARRSQMGGRHGLGRPRRRAALRAARRA
jgi:hypothetical protein